MPRIPIEQKHIYNTYETSVAGNIDIENVVNPVSNFRSIEPKYPVQGTDEDDRIGRKIHVNYISEEGILTLNNFTGENSLLDYWNGYLQDRMLELQPSNYEFPVDNLSCVIPIRHLVVGFEDSAMYAGTDAERGVYLASWFKNLVIQTFPDFGILPSILTDTKRESTPYTGRFKIYRDDKYYLDLKDKHEIHFKYHLPLKSHVNFEAEGSDPTNMHIFSIWIGPVNPFTDYFNRSFGSFLRDTPEIIAPPIVAYVNSTMKLSYIDI